MLKDVYKTTVFALSRWRNTHCPAGMLGPGGPVMPERVIVKPPTAELKPNQTDQDTLPPYDVLDAILEGLVEGELSVDALVAKLADKSPLGLARLKQLVDDGLDQPVEVAMRAEQLMSALHNLSADRAEGLAAFNEKRAPKFTGR